MAFLGGLRLVIAISLLANIGQPESQNSQPIYTLWPARAGAVAVGAAHYQGSAKALAEEGIDPRVRLRAIPMAVSFLTYNSPKCFHA